jgi:hypothetical protein
MNTEHQWPRCAAHLGLRHPSDYEVLVAMQREMDELADEWRHDVIVVYGASIPRRGTLARRLVRTSEIF